MRGGEFSAFRLLHPINHKHPWTQIVTENVADEVDSSLSVSVNVFLLHSRSKVKSLFFGLGLFFNISALLDRCVQRSAFTIPYWHHVA